MSSEPMPLISSSRIGEPLGGSDPTSEPPSLFYFAVIAGMWAVLILWGTIGMMCGI